MVKDMEKPAGPDVKVECYAGYRGDETPRVLWRGGRRLGIARVLSRRRVLDAATGRTCDIWRCRLDDGRTVTLERGEDGAWRASP